MATSVVEIDEVNVTGQLIPFQEFDRVRNAVCLLRSRRLLRSSTKDPSKSWSGTGFYAMVKLKKRNEIFDVHCIITNYHVFLEMKQRGDDMVAVFHHESIDKEAFELPLVPFTLFAHSKGEELDYVLILVDQSRMRSIGVEPILVDGSKLPTVERCDRVYIIQHPQGKRKHFSHDTVKCVNKPYIEYYADTLQGSSGSPVFVLKERELLLIALHNKGVNSESSKWNKGVLVSEVLNHLHTGMVTTSNFSLPGIHDQLESSVSVVVQRVCLRRRRVKSRTEEAVRDVKRRQRVVKLQGVVKLQKVVTAAEKKANKAVGQTQCKCDKAAMEARIQAVEELLVKINKQSDSVENCWNCGRIANASCAGCNLARYCGAFCQRKDLEYHLRNCDQQISKSSPDDGTRKIRTSTATTNCQKCGRTANYLCSGCEMAWYCGPTCQINDWRSHHRVCGDAVKKVKVDYKAATPGKEPGNLTPSPGLNRPKIAPWCPKTRAVKRLRRR